MVERIWRTISRLRNSVFPTNWRVAERRVRCNTFLHHHLLRSVRSRTAGSESDKSFSSRVSNERKSRLGGHRPVSRQFIRLSNDAVKADHNFRMQDAQTKKMQKAYIDLLKCEGTDLGEAQRLRETDALSVAKQERLARLDYAKNIPRLRDMVTKKKTAIHPLLKLRKQALETLYKRAQREIDQPPESDVGELFQMPQKFFSEIQRALDAQRIIKDYAKKLHKTDRALLAIDRQLKDERLDSTDDRAILRAQRREALAAYAQSKIDTQYQEENAALREQNFMDLARPMLAHRRLFETLITDTVSRGSEHKTIKPGKISDGVKNVVRTRDGLNQKRRFAGKMLDAAKYRYDKLEMLYYRDLVRYLTENSLASRLEFDRQFFLDRTQALKGINLLQSFVDDLKVLQRSEKLMELEDVSSKFSSQREDGNAGSESTEQKRSLATKTHAEHSQVMQYIQDTDEKLFGDPSIAKPEPSYEHDNECDLKPIDDDGFEAQTMKEFDPALRRHLPR